MIREAIVEGITTGDETKRGRVALGTTAEDAHQQGHTALQAGVRARLRHNSGRIGVVTGETREFGGLRRWKVANGTATKGRRVNNRSDRFEVTVRPSGNDAVTIRLVGGRTCGQKGAVCTEGSEPRALSASVIATVSGPFRTRSSGHTTVASAILDKVKSVNPCVRQPARRHVEGPPG